MMAAAVARRPAPAPDVHVVANADDPMVVWARAATRGRPLVTWVSRRPALARRLLGLPRVRLAPSSASGERLVLHRLRPAPADAAVDASTDDGVVDPDRRLAPGHPAAARPGQPRPTPRPRSPSPPSSASARPTRCPASARSPRSPAATPQVDRDGRTIRLLLAKNPAGWLEAFDMAERRADPAVHQRPRPRRPRHLLALRRRLLAAARPAGADHRRPGDTTWPSGWRSTRSRSSTSRRSPSAVPPCRPAGSRSSRTTPRSRTSERSWTVSTDRATGRTASRSPAHRLDLPRPAVHLRRPRQHADPGPPGATCAACRSRPSRSAPTSRCPTHGRHLPARRRRGRPAGAGRRSGCIADGGLHRAVDQRRGRVRASAPATSCSAPRSSPRARKYAGLDLLDLTSDRGPTRAVGELAGDDRPARWACRTLTGFENHGGRTHLGPGVAPLARVTAGIGNDGATEGAWHGKHPRHLHRTARRWPATRPWPTCCCAGPPARTAAPLDDTWPDRLRAERLAAAGRRDPGTIRRRPRRLLRQPSAAPVRPCCVAAASAPAALAAAAWCRRPGPAAASCRRWSTGSAPSPRSRRSASARCCCRAGAADAASRWPAGALFGAAGGRRSTPWPPR